MAAEPGAVVVVFTAVPVKMQKMTCCGSATRRHNISCPQKSNEVEKTDEKPFIV